MPSTRSILFIELLSTQYSPVNHRCGLAEQISRTRSCCMVAHLCRAVGQCVCESVSGMGRVHLLSATFWLESDEYFMVKNEIAEIAVEVNTPVFPILYSKLESDYRGLSYITRASWFLLASNSRKTKVCKAHPILKYVPSWSPECGSHSNPLSFQKEAKMCSGFQAHFQIP